MRVKLRAPTPILQAMPRLILVVCLSLSLLAAGCRESKEERVERLGLEAGRPR
jgi:hypothetical protein